MAEELNQNAMETVEQTDQVKQTGQIAESKETEAASAEETETVAASSEPSAVPPMVMVDEAAVLEDDGRTPIVTEKGNQKGGKEKK